MTAVYPETAETDVFSAARAQVAAMESHLRSATALAATHAELEAYVGREGRELQRLLLQGHLQLRGAQETRVEVRGADGVRRGYGRASARPLTSIFGSVSVLRLAYQREGVEGLHPMDAALNLPEELHSHGVRRLVAEHVARSSFAETTTIVVQSIGATLAKRQVEQLAVRAAQDFERPSTKCGRR